MNIHRLSLTLGPNAKRVLLRPFMPSLIVKPVSRPDESNSRVVAIFSRVMMLNNAQVEAKLSEVMAEFNGRHPHIAQIFEKRFEQIRPLIPTDRELDTPRKMLLGSYFTNEYSFESSALFNPSITPAPDQTGMDEGQLHFILSLRATGEGHISSLTFRSGVIDSGGGIRMDPVSRYVYQPKPLLTAHYELKTFLRKLQEIGIEPKTAASLTAHLGQHFSMDNLEETARSIRRVGGHPHLIRAAEQALMLAEANYTVRFDDGLDISEKILFPHAPEESNGIEDARFVRFVDDNGAVTYHATYTAYNGRVVFPQLVSTTDFQEFAVRTLNGPAVRNKGLALFPRKIKGRYAMLGRQDSENIHLMFSDYLYFWHDSQVILRPSEPWEFIQLGNCGSPIETEAGWLVLTHGVGPMRKYCIGAALLDLEDPSRVIGRLHTPLLSPLPDEREGYVPNVVYSCGALIHHGNLVIPYAISDTASRFATVALGDLIAAMRQ